MKLLYFVLLVIAGLIAHRYFFSFSAQQPRHYSDTLPAADLRKHLNGPIDSEGVIFGPLGRVTGRFVAKMKGTWTNRIGTLTEEFSYDSGVTQRREWTITQGDDGKFTATAPDIEGIAQGEISGATIRMTYRIRLPESAGSHVLDVTDWLYVMENGTIMNRSVMKKWGIKVAELIATMRPAEQSDLVAAE